MQWRNGNGAPGLAAVDEIFRTDASEPRCNCDSNGTQKLRRRRRRGRVLQLGPMPPATAVSIFVLSALWNAGTPRRMQSPAQGSGAAGC